MGKWRNREPKSTSRDQGRGGRESWGKGAHGVWQEGEASLLAGNCATERGRRLLRQYGLVGFLCGGGASAADREAEGPQTHCWRHSRHPLPCLAAFLDALLAYGSSPLSSRKLPDRRRLTLFHHTLTTKAAARCPVWARKACDPRTRGGGHWTRELEDGGWWVPGRKIGVGAGTDDEGDCGVTWRLGLGGES